MAQVIVRNLEEPVKRRLKALAASHGHSMEEEVRQILRRAVAVATATDARPDQQKGLGTELMERLGESPLSDEEWQDFDEGIRATRRGIRPRDVELGS